MADHSEHLQPLDSPGEHTVALPIVQIGCKIKAKGKTKAAVVISGSTMVARGIQFQCILILKSWIKVILKIKFQNSPKKTIMLLG